MAASEGRGVRDGLRLRSDASIIGEGRKGGGGQASRYKGGSEAEALLHCSLTLLSAIQFRQCSVILYKVRY